jgi:hypothetical protein
MMVRWWKARSWEQKLGLGTLIVTVLGTLIVPVYLEVRNDDGSRRSGAAAPTAGSPSSSPVPTVPPTTATDPTGGEPPTSGEETGSGPAQPLTPGGKVVRYLSDMEPVEGEYAATGAFSINGVAHAHSLAFDQYLTSYATEYDLGRAFDSFKVTIGLRDDSSSAGRTKFEVFLDGRSAAARTVGLGKAVDLDIPVGGVLRLRLVATPVHTRSVEVFSTWGDARLLGDPAKVPPTT